jgi:hypothetical protein
MIRYKPFRKLADPDGLVRFTLGDDGRLLTLHRRCRADSTDKWRTPATATARIFQGAWFTLSPRQTEPNNERAKNDRHQHEEIDRQSVSGGRPRARRDGLCRRHCTGRFPQSAPAAPAVGAQRQRANQRESSAVHARARIAPVVPAPTARRAASLAPPSDHRATFRWLLAVQVSAET